LRAGLDASYHRVAHRVPAAHCRSEMERVAPEPFLAPTLYKVVAAPDLATACLTFSKILRSDDPICIDWPLALMDRQTLFVESDDGRPIYVVPRNSHFQIYIARHLACHHTVQKP
jgi:hypothetical protein